VQLDSGHSKKFEDILNETSDFTKQNISASSIVGDGILPRSYGEYRSYYQLPYIYFNKLFQIFQTKAEEVTGYKIKLDGSWFSSYNPYWSKLVYMLHPFNIKNGETYDNYYTLAFYGAKGKPTIIKPASTGKVYHPVSDLQAE
jgi:hypothetical protein